MMDCQLFRPAYSHRGHRGHREILSFDIDETIPNVRAFFSDQKDMCLCVLGDLCGRKFLT
jgi:hypothetical protein